LVIFRKLYFFPGENLKALLKVVNLTLSYRLKKNLLAMSRTYFIIGIFLFGYTSFLSGQIVPTNQDCLGAIPVCQQIYIENQSPSGDGNYNNEINTAISCTAGELNSIWYRFTVNQDGDFGFLITPNDPDDDYDWTLFDITNADCGDIATDPSLVVSCNAAGGVGCHGPTGADGSTTWSVQGAGCGFPDPGQAFGNTPLNALIPVVAGNTYVLMVSNWTGSPNGYTIDFGLSTGIDIFDETPPQLANAVLPTSCDETTITLELDEFIDCGTVSADGFQLSGPGGPYNLSIASSICDAGGPYDNSFELTVDPPISALGDFTLSLDLNTTLADPCGNLLEPFSLDFTVDEPREIPVDLGPSPVELCGGDTLTLDATSPNSTYLWQDGSINATYLVTAGGLYLVEVADQCGTGADSVEVEFIENPAEVDLGGEAFLCPGDTLLLDPGINNANYEWQNGETSSTFMVLEEGTYSVTITSPCNTYTPSVEVLPCEDCEPYYPNIFTPDSDGTNDFFGPKSNCQFTDYHLKVYSRWGDLVFETRDPTNLWDGTFQGAPAQMDTYVWFVSCSLNENGNPRNFEASGEINLIR
jgi:gliding motility-associated-like protein